MEHLKHLNFLANFPRHQYPRVSTNQKEALEIIAKQGSSVIFELPTGSGKTAIGYTFLLTLLRAGYRRLFYAVPTKTLVDQVKQFHPDVKIMYGRNEYECLFYGSRGISAERVPCTMLECPHRVDQETGRTEITDVEPCPYLLARYQARQGGIVVCTFAFYLLSHLFNSEYWPEPDGLVIDEVHDVVKNTRNVLSYEITDFHLARVIALLQEVNANQEAEILDQFLKNMVRIIKHKPASRATLLEDYEIRELMDIFVLVNSREMIRKIRAAVKERIIDPFERREIIEKAQIIGRDLNRYLHSMEYSLTTSQRHALNYAYAYYEKERDESRRVQYRLSVKVHSVAPLIKKVLSPFTVAYSATVGDARILSWISGIEAPFYTFGSEFPVDNTRVLVPIDTPNLSFKEKGRREPTKTLRRIAKICFRFNRLGVRSLLVVISEKERQRFLTLAKEENVNAVSYGNGVRPREAAVKFKAGEGGVLVGTVANYGEGIDLPKGIAPLIFFLRPSRPHPDDPATIFEQRRFGGQCWAIWNWEAMLQVLQVRGRDVRGPEDLGVTIFVSQQFRKFIPAALPDWLQGAYRGSLTLEQCLDETKQMLGL